SARVLAALGFEALATTSSGFAFTLGRLDGGVTLAETVEHVERLVAATDLPVSVDLENGYDARPAGVAEAVARVAEAGAVVAAGAQRISVGGGLTWVAASAMADAARAVRDGDFSPLAARLPLAEWFGS